ncbi:MAG: hypothetical protein BroJett018_26190 [Chloroflexota bacterium]|nr:MAG: hypothetical protein BroJett018_26190 [Chloroflexota bacterium]
MTEHERQQGFYAAVRAAELTYGLTIQAELTTEPLGEAVLMRPHLVIVPLAGWVDQSPSPAPNSDVSQPLRTE